MSNKMKQKQKLRYASARDRAEKKQQEASFSSSYLTPPSGVKFFKPKAGVYQIDILPFRAGPNNPCAEEGLLHYERTYHLHQRIGADSRPYLCPRLTSKSKCPICEHRMRLLKEADPDNESLVKDLAPRERQLFNVINLKEPETGVMIWDISYHLFGKLLDARIRNSDEDEGWDQFAALSGGFTLKVGFKENSFGGRNFIEAETIDFKPRAEDYDEDILEKVHCLDELLTETEYADLKAVFLESAQKDDDEEEDDEDEAPTPKRKSKPTPREEDEDEDDEDADEAPPKKKGKPAPEEEEDEDADADDDEEPAPKKGKKPVEEDEDDDDWDEAPVKSKKKPVEDDEDEDADDEDEPAPKKGRKPAPEEEEEDADDEVPAPKRRGKAAPVEDDDEDEEDEDEDAKPRVRTKDEEDEEEETRAKRKGRR